MNIKDSKGRGDGCGWADSFSRGSGCGHGSDGTTYSAGSGDGKGYDNGKG